MSDKYLSDLAKRILYEAPHGLTKVKFAKMLYFTNKYLVQNGLVEQTQLGFIRMPLGPVPVGFKTMTDPEISVEEVPMSTLSYDKQVYRLISGDIFSDNFQAVIKKAVESLINLSTSRLVEFSHQEPSWVNHVNGEEYYLEEADLNIDIPNVQEEVSINLEDQKLQAKLVEGILDDIVADSTALEYPGYDGK
jgi:hypothetical protein